MDEIEGGGNGMVQRRPVRIGSFSKAKRKRFLDTLAGTCKVNLAVRAAGVASSSCYRARLRDADFAAAWDEALATCYQRLEEALLDYALARIAGETPDPDAADPEAPAHGTPATPPARNISPNDLNLAITLLNRRREGGDGKGRAGRKVKIASAAETDAALRRKLDRLARRMGPQ
ncbi:MAG: hypothetical protein WCS75_10565 [Sphingomonas sp.]|jgi:hypothetical protein|uniref:hypothetical protein n=1 Tax=Sphingomonas sp. TaxID=28214 RepID=UPI00356AB175